MTEMLDDVAKAKLRDPAYFALHTQAVAAIARVGQFNWYDSNFLRRFEAAKIYLSSVRPNVLPEFVEGFAPLRTPHDFAVSELRDVFDDATRDRIIEVCRTAAVSDDYEDQFERENFGRSVVWHDPYFIDLQHMLTDRVSALAGQKLQTGYNFLSLYGGSGRCDPHMDEPYSMYTLDYCIEQSGDWPIHFSKVVDWPTLETVREWDADKLKADASLDFASKVLKPNQAVFFSGSSQWHYRDAITQDGFCNLLFFHYFPAGCEGLVTPSKWAEHFSIPELGPLCDLFGEAGCDGFG